MEIRLNSVSPSAFLVNASQVADNTHERAEFISKGRVLIYTHAQKGKNAMLTAMGKAPEETIRLSRLDYQTLNEQFQREHLLYAAKKCCEYNGKIPPETWEAFRGNAQSYYKNQHFWAVLSGVYEEILTPVLPAVYSEAVSQMAAVVEVGFGETYSIAVGSNDIPVFQDSSWGASRSVPRNRLYPSVHTLNPQPKSAWITAKYMQLIGTGMDFGAFFANIVAGMYSKTMGMWNEALRKATSDTNLIPAALNYTFNNQNWVSAANKIAALNAATISNLFAVGSMVALSKVLPTEATGSTNVNMDAAIATLLGADYTRSGYLGEFMAVRLMPMVDAVIPGTQNTTVETILSPNDIYMVAGSRLKPLVIAYNRETPIAIEMDPTKAADFEIGINLTIALDSAAVFASKIAHFTI